MRPLSSLLLRRRPKANVEVVDFKLEDDNLKDEDGAVSIDATLPRTPFPKLKTTIASDSSFVAATTLKKTKGYSFQEESDVDCNNRLSGCFDSLDFDGGSNVSSLSYSMKIGDEDVDFIDLLRWKSPPQPPPLYLFCCQSTTTCTFFYMS
ncbi:hypothetical protein ACSBR1_017249 [Camellia fascicularis]